MRIISSLKSDQRDLKSIHKNLDKKVNKALEGSNGKSSGIQNQKNFREKRAHKQEKKRLIQMEKEGPLGWEVRVWKWKYMSVIHWKPVNKSLLTNLNMLEVSIIIFVKNLKGIVSP